MSTSSKSPPYLSVVVPAYNEEKRLSKTLVALWAYLGQQPFTSEIVIVLDGVTDNTLGIIEDFAGDKDAIRWVNRAENKGKGFTVRQGMLEAKGDVRLYLDADNSTDISHFDLMKPFFEQGQQVVIASRDSKDVDGAKQAVPQPFHKRLLGNLGNLFIQVMAVPGIWDTQCGFKAFSAESAQKIFSVSKIDRWGFDIEALALARRYGYKISIVPAHWIDDADTNVRLINYIDTLVETIRIRLNLLRGAYPKRLP